MSRQIAQPSAHYELAPDEALALCASGISSDPNRIGRIAYVNDLEACTVIRYVGVTANHLHAPSIPACVVTSSPNRIGRRTYVNDLQAGRAIRHVGVIAYHLDASTLPGGVVTSEPDRAWRVADVEYDQSAISRS